MIGHDGNVRLAFQNLHRKHRQGSLWSNLDEQPASCLVHGLNLLGPFNRRGHLWCQLFQNGGLGVGTFHRVKAPVNIGRDGHVWPPNLKILQETAQRFVRRCDNFRVESVGRGERHAGIPLLLKGSHGSFHGCGFTSDNGHLGRVFVGGDDVALGGSKHGFDGFVRSGHAGHEPFVVDFNSAHFGSSGSRCSQGAVHIKNS